MSFSFDIFHVDADGPLWRDAATDLSSARAKVKELSAVKPGEYFLLEQRTGIKHPVNFDGDKN